MNHMKVVLLLLCITASLAQDNGTKDRFDKILEQFGFSGIGAEQTRNTPTVTEGRQQQARVTPRTASSQRTGSVQRNRDFDIQSNDIPDIRQKSQPIRKNENKALAALFSVAGKAKGTKRPAQNVRTSQSRSKQNTPIKLPVTKRLNERIENPIFESESPSRRIVNNRGLIANERNVRIKTSGRNNGVPKNKENKQNLRKDGRRQTNPTKVKTLDIRQQLSTLNVPKQKFTSRGIPIVASVPNNKNGLNNLKAIAGASAIPSSALSNANQGAPHISTPQRPNSIQRKNPKPAFDPVANLVTIANSKSTKATVQTQKPQVRDRRPSPRGRNNPENVRSSPLKLSSRNQGVSQSTSRGRGQIPPQIGRDNSKINGQKIFHGVSKTPTATNSPKESATSTFNFDETLKEFGFSPRLISGSSFKTENTPPIRKESKAALPVRNESKASPSNNQRGNPFTVFPGDIRKSANLASNTPSFTSKGIPIISSKPLQTEKGGLSSLIALAGDPQQNPVAKITNPLSSANQPTTRRPPTIRQGQAQNSRKSPNSRLSPTNSALGNLESIASGNGPTRTVKNRARGPSRKSSTKEETRNNLPTKTSTPSQSTFSSGKKESLFEINPFVNANLQKQQSETLRSQNANIRENANKVQVTKAQAVPQNEEEDKRINIPRQRPSPNTSNRPKIFIDEEAFEDSLEEETADRRTEPRRKEQKKQKEEQRERPKKKRPHKQKKEQKIEQRPPVAAGCFHVCTTLIFEVYKLLGGSLCDCVR